MTGRLRWRAMVLAAAALGLVACFSPEASRSRGGGPGADVGNRGAVLEFHDGAEPFYGTPLRAPR